MDKSERHVTHWDVSVVRGYHSFYTFGASRYDPEPIPAVTVEFSATFDDNEAAEAFEFAVREILEKA